MSWFSDVVDKMGGLGGMMQGAGAIASGIGAFQGAKAAEKLAKDQFNYNKMLNEEERKRRKQADDSLAGGFANSNYGKEQVKA